MIKYNILVKTRKEINKMKKFTAVLMAALLIVCVFAGCSDDSTKTNEEISSDAAAPAVADVSADSAESDLEYVKNKGTLVVGVTDFEPMDYLDADGNWIGFDADMATAFAESLGVEVQFVEIDWDYKIFELDSKSLDCVWNGMTLTDEVLSSMSCSEPYCNNAQIVIVPAADADKYQTAEDCKDLTFAVEAGSAGKGMAEENGFKFTEVDKQATALMEVAAGTCDAAIIDSLMAAAMVGEGTAYENLAYTVKLNSEEYGVGFRQGSDLTAALNEFFKTSAENGTTDELAEKYGVQAAIIK